MARLDPSLKHAITPPTFDEKKLHREALVDQLHSQVPRKFVSVTTPPGFGKTTLLSDFATHTQLPTIWIQLTDLDRDVLRLATVFLASLEKRFRRLRAVLTLEAFSSASPTELANALGNLISSQVPEGFVMLIDDVHVLNDSEECLEFFDRLLQVLPAHVTVIAAGRQVPEISLARLMAEGDLAGFGPHNLAFGKDELRLAIKKALEIDLTDEELDTLAEESRGWITGALLSRSVGARFLEGISDTNREFVYQYLASVVLNRLADPLRRFMIDASILPVMTEQSCNTVLNRNDSGKLLGELTRTGLFVTVTDTVPPSFEFHPMFRSFLMETLRESDRKRYEEIILKSADLHIESGYPEFAVQLYCDIDAREQAKELMTSTAFEMRRQGRYATLRKWEQIVGTWGSHIPELAVSLSLMDVERRRLADAIDRLQEVTDQSHLDLTAPVSSLIACTMGLALVAGQDYKGAKKWAALAASEIDGKTPVTTRAMLWRLQALIAFRAEKDFETAETCASKAVHLLDHKQDPYSLANALDDLNLIQFEAGKTQDAYRTAARSLEIREKIGVPSQIAVAYNNLAVHSHFRGNYDDALSQLRESRRFARQAGNLAHEAAILFGQADVFNDLGLSLPSAELYAEGLSLAAQIDDRDLVYYGCIQTATLHRRSRNFAISAEWIKRAVEFGPKGESDLDVQIQLAAIESETSPGRSVARLEAVLSKDQSEMTARERIQAEVCLASSKARAGDKEGARVGLAHALSRSVLAGLEQLAAADIRFDPDAYRMAQSILELDPSAGVILARIDMMSAVASEYGANPLEASPTPKIRLRGMGKTEVAVGNAPVEDLKPQFKELLFYLAANSPVDRDAVLDVFWPDHRPGRQTANLHMAVYSLRQYLGKDAVQLDGNSYSLASTLVDEPDFERFEHAASVAERLPIGEPRRYFALIEAINAYGGPFLPEFGSDWIIEKRRGLELQYLDLLAQHAEEAVARDQTVKAFRSLREALQIDPYRDDLNSQYLQLLGKMDRRSEAVEHYQRYASILASDLGLDPSPEVQRVYERLIS